MAIDYKGPIEYSIEIAIEKISDLLKANYYISRRSVALLLLQDDEEIKKIVAEREGDAIAKIEEILKEARAHFVKPIAYEIAIERQNEVKSIIEKVVKIKRQTIGVRESLSQLTMNPVTGVPILLLVLYWGLYKFVGRFGAGIVVDFLEAKVFDKYITPFSSNIIRGVIPWPIFQDLFIGEYGIITMAARYAFSIILPIVTFFFITFSIIEDTGYLPRLAMLIDRVFKKIGLSGRAVIPMVLGFGCATMATMVTRILPTKRERIIATLLLVLAVPCSAQLGVIMALLATRPKAMFLWLGIIGITFLFIGYLTSKILPGDRPSFYMEVPPLRIPNMHNIFMKVYVRVKWYFKEILPIFLWVSVFIWLGQIFGLFDLVIKLFRTPVQLIGLPEQASKVFIFGFFRRDYGTAGLYDLNAHSLLTGTQLVVSCVALTLFLPCVAQFLINIKERGWKIGILISVFVLFFSFTVAYILNIILTRLGVAL